MEAPKPWHPGVLLEGTSSVQDVLKTISFVRGSPGYANIGAKLEARNCTTVDNLAEYSSVEFCALAKGCEIKRKARVYQAAIEAAIQRRLPAENAIKSELGSTKVKTETGGDMMQRSCKVAPTDGFNPTKYTPDALVYSDVLGEAGEYIGDEAEKLYLDKLWLFVQADPEPSIGDYLQPGMKQRLAKLHTQMGLPSFRPSRAGKLNEKARDTSDVIYHRFFNGRFTCYKRVVLDVKHKYRFSEKVQQLITFVDSHSDALTDNPLNSAFEHFLKVHAGEVVKCEPGRLNQEKMAPPATAPAAAEVPAATSSTTASGDASDAPTEVDLSQLDGMIIQESRGTWNHPELPKRQGATPAPAAPVGGGNLTKKDQLKAKRAAGKGASGHQAKKAKQHTAVLGGADSSEEDSSEDEDGGATSRGCGVRARFRFSFLILPLTLCCALLQLPTDECPSRPSRRPSRALCSRA